MSITFRETVPFAQIDETIARYIESYSPPDLVVEIGSNPDYTHGYDCPHRHEWAPKPQEDCTGNCGPCYRLIFTFFIEKVLDDREENGYDDSDFYAVVWDPAREYIRRIDYASTRYGGGGGCVVDADEEAKAAAEVSLADIYFHRLRAQMAEEAVKVTTGKLVSVTSGRKYKGLVGEVTWRGPNPFQHRGPDRVRIQPKDGAAFFTSVDQVAVVDPTPVDEDEVLRMSAQYASSRQWAAATSRVGFYLW